jgi:hypothetical protein
MIKTHTEERFPKKTRNRKVYELVVRINTRVTPEQKEYIKNYAESKNLTEGELHRMIIEKFMKSHKI